MRSAGFPRAIVGEDSVEVRISGSSPARRLPQRITLDFNLNGKIIGLEILGLKASAGENASRPLQNDLEGNGVRVAYDNEADALAAHVASDDSSDQESVDGWVELDSDARLVAIGAKFTPGRAAERHKARR